MARPCEAPDARTRTPAHAQCPRLHHAREAHAPLAALSRVLFQSAPHIADPHSPPTPTHLRRCVLYLLRVHHKPLVASRALVELLQPIAAALHERVGRERATLGFNVAALGFLQQAIERSGEANFFGDALEGRSAAPASVAELRRKTAAREKARAGKKPNKRRE